LKNTTLSGTVPKSNRKIPHCREQFQNLIEKYHTVREQFQNKKYHTVGTPPK
jgi:uncharacterized coiled-coil protein SlyX